MEFCSDVNQAWSGVEHKPCTTQLLESAGLFFNYASFGNDAIGIFGSIGSSAMIRSAPTANPFTLPTGQSPSTCCSPSNPLQGTTYTDKVLNQMRLNSKTALPDNHAW